MDVGAQQCSDDDEEEDDEDACWLFAAEGAVSGPSPSSANAALLQLPLRFLFGDGRSLCLAPAAADAGTISAALWGASLLTASFLAGCPVSASPEVPDVPRVCGRDVLEVGCGRGLAGLVCAELLDAKRVVLTDCDDRALRSLLCRQSDVLAVRRLLWEQDEADEELGSAGPQRRHWSDAHRDESAIETLPYGTTFDVVIACDCLYFPSQEMPLASVIRTRLRKRDGVALITFQPRENGALQVVRLVEALRCAGLVVQESQGPWFMEQLLQNHVRCWAGQETLEFTQTIHECGPLHLIVASWQ